MRTVAIALLLPASIGLTSTMGFAAQCGKEGQAACKVWERVFPSCDQYLVERGGRCVHPSCGRLGQRPCTVDVRIPSCDAGLIEWGTCLTKGECGAAFQRPCTVADEKVPSCNAGLSEDFGKKECVPTRAGHVPFLDGLNSLTDEVAKGSKACEGFLLTATSVQKVEWFGAVAKESQAVDALEERIDFALDCRRHMAVGFICATPSQARKIGAPVEIYNNLSDAYQSKTCAPEAQGPAWRHQPARLLGPSIGLNCRYQSPPEYDAPFFDPIPAPTVKGAVLGSCWACPKFTFRSATHVQDAQACTRGDDRDPQLRAMCATFTTFVDHGVKPLQCFERLISAVASGQGSRADLTRVCAIAGSLAFDMAVDVMIGRVDPKSKLKKLAEAVAQVRTGLKGPALLVKMNDEARGIDACRELFSQ